MSFLKRTIQELKAKKEWKSSQQFADADNSFAPAAPAAPAIDLKAKPEDFEDWEFLPDGRKRLAIKNGLLAESDTLVLIDDSWSMNGKYWSLVQAELALIVDVLIQNDPDGIDLFFLNHKSDEAAVPNEGRAGTGYLKVQNPEFVVKIFKSVRPDGGTPTAGRLGLILDAYISHCQRLHERDENARPRPLNIIVLTDGECSREPLKQVIIKAARNLDEMNAPESQCGIQFFQVGNEPGVSAWLKELDDELQDEAGLTRDMVDTKKYEDIIAAGGFNARSLLGVIVGGLSKRHDRMK